MSWGFVLGPHQGHSPDHLLFSFSFSFSLSHIFAFSPTSTPQRSPSNSTISSISTTASSDSNRSSINPQYRSYVPPPPAHMDVVGPSEAHHTARIAETRARMTAELYARRRAERKGRTTQTEPLIPDVDSLELVRRDSDAREAERIITIRGMGEASRRCRVGTKTGKFDRQDCDEGMISSKRCSNLREYTM